MSCLKQRTIVNRRYVKLAGSVPRAEELFIGAPDLYLVVDCGRCLPCQKKRATMWRQRLLDEYHYMVSKSPDLKYRVFFVTLTIAPQYYKKDIKVAYSLFKHFRERYRKTYGVSLRYWLTSEYGEKRGRLHFHAIFFNPLFDCHELSSMWKYGRCDMSVVGDSPKNPTKDPNKGIASVTKYITKYVDKWFINWDERSFIWCSPGLGTAYTRDLANRNFHNQFGGLFFRTDDSNRFPIALPRLYVQKLFSPIDLKRRSKNYIKRINSAPEFPKKIGSLTFDSFIPYVNYLNSIGGKCTLLSSQLPYLSSLELKTYFNQPNYE